MKTNFLIFSILLSAATHTLTAQTQNPDMQPLQDGPIKVLNAPPRSQPQEDPNRPQTILDKLRLGGTFGLSLGSITHIEASPIVALQLTPKITTGAGIIYQYYKSSPPYSSYQNSVYGGRVFGMYSIVSGLNAHVEYQSINQKYLDYSPTGGGAYKPIWLSSLLIGGTYSQPTGGRLVRAINISALYNVSYYNQVNPTNSSQNIAYASPVSNYILPNTPLVIRVSFF